MREVHRINDVVVVLEEIEDEVLPGDKAVLLDGVPPDGGYQEGD